MVSVVPLVPILVCVGVYFVHLASIGVIPSFQALITYLLLLGVLILAIGVGIYEVASSFKVKKPFSFRVKRFLSRTVYVSTFILAFYCLWSLFTLLFSPFLKLQYILIISLLSLSLTVLALVQNPKTRRLIKKLTQEER